MHKGLPKHLHIGSYVKNAIETLKEFQIEFFLVLSILITTSFLIYFLIHFVITDRENLIDQSVFLLARQLLNPAGMQTAKIITVMGTGNFLVPAYILMVLYLKKQNYYCLAYLTGVTAVTSLLLGWLLKWIFHRSRPLGHLVNGAGGYSFPSGHALGGFIFSGLILYLLWNTRLRFYTKCLISLFAILLGLAIGASRIYLHVHYATDVIGSLFFAVWWLLLIHIVFRFLFKNNISRQRETLEESFIQDNYHLYN